MMRREDGMSWNIYSMTPSYMRSAVIFSVFYWPIDEWCLLQALFDSHGYLAADILKKTLRRMNGEARTSKHRSSIWLPPWLRCKYWSQGGSQKRTLYLIFPNVVYRLSWCWVCVEVTVTVKEASDACLMHNSAIRSSNGVSIRYRGDLTWRRFEGCTSVRIFYSRWIDIEKEETSEEKRTCHEMSIWWHHRTWDLSLPIVS